MKHDKTLTNSEILLDAVAPSVRVSVLGLVSSLPAKAMITWQEDVGWKHHTNV